MGPTGLLSSPLGSISQVECLWTGCSWCEMEDESVKREVWEGKVPVCFSVAGGEVGLNMAGERVIPEPCYVSGWSAYVRRSLGV